VQITPDEIIRAAWIGVAASVATAAALTLLAFVLHLFLLRSTRMRLLASTASAIISFFILFAAGMVMITVTNQLVNGPIAKNGSYFVTRVWIDPGPEQKLIPLAAIVATWLIAFAVRHTLVKRRLSNSG
jgi:pilus assembly protein TadC